MDNYITTDRTHVEREISSLLGISSLMLGGSGRRLATEVERETNPRRLSGLAASIDKMLELMAVRLFCESEYRELALSIIIRQIKMLACLRQEVN